MSFKCTGLGLLYTDLLPDRRLEEIDGCEIRELLPYVIHMSNICREYFRKGRDEVVLKTGLGFIPNQFLINF